MAARVELRHLRYFVEVAEQLHFGGAARRLRIAQPSLSQQIRMLEQALGVVLLERDSRRVTLTEAGAVYLVQARAILADVDTAAMDATRAQRGELGRLSIGFLSLLALDVLPPLLRRFRERHPAVTLTLWERSTEEQIRGVLDGSLDLGIVRQPAAVSAIASRHVLSDDQVVALPARHSLATHAEVSVDQLRDEAFILFPRSEGTAMFDRIIAACGRAGFSPRVVQEARFMTTMIGLVASGFGVAILPSVVLGVHHPDVAYRPLVPRLSLETRLIWNPQTLARKPALRAFIGDRTREPRIASKRKG